MEKLSVLLIVVLCNFAGLARGTAKRLHRGYDYLKISYNCDQRNWIVNAYSESDFNSGSLITDVTSTPRITPDGKIMVEYEACANRKLVLKINDKNFLSEEAGNSSLKSAADAAGFLTVIPVSDKFGDVIVLDLEMYIDDDSLICAQSIFVYVHGGVKFDVSTGPFFTLGLFDKSYYTDSTGNNNVFRIKEKSGQNSYIPGVGVQLNIYSRSSFLLKPGLSLAVATNGEEVKYFGGGSFIFGRYERIILSFGAALGKVDRLDSKYDVGQNLAEDIEDLPMERVWKVGYFVGLTYNLSAKNKAFMDKFGK